MLKLNHFGNGVNPENLYKTVQAIACLEIIFKVARVVIIKLFFIE